MSTEKDKIRALGPRDRASVNKGSYTGSYSHSTYRGKCHLNPGFCGDHYVEQSGKFSVEKVSVAHSGNTQKFCYQVPWIGKYFLFS